jgi:hypothetical protein
VSVCHTTATGALWNVVAVCSVPCIRSALMAVCVGFSVELRYQVHICRSRGCGPYEVVVQAYA